MTAPHHPRTSWPTVALLLGTGVIAAFQVGKAPIALPGIRADFAVGLEQAAWVLSAFPLVGALAGAPMGVAVTRLGPRPMLMAALMLLAASSGAGAFAPGLPWLLATRIAEGLGLLVVVIAAPALMTRLINPRDRAVAFGVWGCFMPVGMAIAMLSAPFLSALGWRGLWLAMAGLVAAYAVVVRLRLPEPAPLPPEPPSRLATDLAATLSAPGPLLLAAAFASYTLAWAALTGFLPTLLIERMGVAPGTAGLLTALATTANVLGNLVSGPLLRAGVPRWSLIACASTVIAACGLGIFAAEMPGWAAFGLCLVLTASGGLLPGSVIGGAAAHAPDPRLVPATLGLIMQGSNLGLVLGPALVGWAVAAGGWGAARAVLLPSAGLGVLLALALRRSGRTT